MELVEGSSLAETLGERGPMPPGQATTIALSVLAALGNAHAAGVVHRDVKPSNILLADDGSVKLLDFGIAGRLDEITRADASEVVGTPKYLAPERLDGRAATAATDVYAVGVVLFEMLTGAPPFERDTPVATALAHRDVPVPDVRSTRADVPAALAAVIARCDGQGSNRALRECRRDASRTQSHHDGAGVRPAADDASDDASDDAGEMSDAGDAAGRLRPAGAEPVVVGRRGGRGARRRPADVVHHPRRLGWTVSARLDLDDVGERCSHDHHGGDRRPDDGRCERQRATPTATATATATGMATATDTGNDKDKNKGH